MKLTMEISDEEVYEIGKKAKKMLTEGITRYATTKFLPFLLAV